jgi:hypothetical protein
MRDSRKEQARACFKQHNIIQARNAGQFGPSSAECNHVVKRILLHLSKFYSHRHAVGVCEITFQVIRLDNNNWKALCFGCGNNALIMFSLTLVSFKTQAEKPIKNSRFLMDQVHAFKSPQRRIKLIYAAVRPCGRFSNRATFCQSPHEAFYEYIYF